jgi:hypothetical protein
LLLDSSKRPRVRKRLHDAATYFVSYSYNFCWAVRTLRVKEDERWQARTPAMAAGLADHVWSLREWLTYPAKPCAKTCSLV